MARRAETDRWFVSVEVPRAMLRGSQRATIRQTRTFATENEAKQFAKEMLLANRKNVIAGTLLSADPRARRIISGAQLYRWVEEGET